MSSNSNSHVSIQERPLYNGIMFGGKEILDR